MRERLTDETLEQYAREYVRAYCKKYNCWNDFDDLAQDVACWLLERREKWTAEPWKIRADVLSYLVDRYRKEAGTRRKYARGLETLERDPQERRDAFELLERRETLALLIERAITETNSERWKAWIEMYLDGLTSREIGERVGANPRNVRRKLQPFKERLNELIRELRDANETN